MYTDVILPNLGFGMEEGRIIDWLKAPGDPVRRGEVLAEIESDKATVELEALADGTLAEILAPADALVPIGSVIARIRTGEASTVAEQAAGQMQSSPAQREQESPKASPVARRLAREHDIELAAVTGSGRDGRITRDDVQRVIDRPQRKAGRVMAAPAVRRLARDHNIDLKSLRGAGRNGRVTRAEVESAIDAASEPTVTAAPAVEAPDIEREEIHLSQMRRTIAQRLSQSMQEKPHFYVSGELDFTTAVNALPPDIGINALLLYLTVRALGDVPELNATYENGHLYHYPHVNLAVAVALPDGLITPVLHRADDYSLSGLASRARDLIQRARQQRLRLDELQGGTFTVSNLGMNPQVNEFVAIINPPQVGILAVGAVKERPFVIDGGLHIRTTAQLTVSADHRAVDGVVSARFLEAFDRHLQRFST